MVVRFRHGLANLKGGLLVRSFLPSTVTTQFGEPSLVLLVQPTTDSRRLIELPFLADGRSAVMAEASLPAPMRRVRGDLAIDRHSELLMFFAEQALVKSVELPPILETTPATGGTTLGRVDVPEPLTDVDYPTVAIIDGGASNVFPLDKWKVGDAGLVPLSDRDEQHGTFIAGLVSAGSSLNPNLNGTIEPRGCKFFDLDLFPRRELRSTYYPDIEDLSIRLTRR